MRKKTGKVKEVPSKQVHINEVADEMVLYHYTKSNGGNGILNNNYFWATKSDFLNDQKVNFREKDGFLIPYMEIPLDKEKLPVREIMVAPQNHIDLAKNGMDYMLQYKGYEVPVTLSNIKLRY